MEERKREELESQKEREQKMENWRKRKEECVGMEMEVMNKRERVGKRVMEEE